MAGIIAAGILGASLQNMAISIATERSDGTLKSLAGTPMPKAAYFVGKVVQVLAVTVLIIVDPAARSASSSTASTCPSGSDWFTFAWVVGAGRRRPARCSGIAVSSLAKNGRSASAMVTPIALVLQFISGVFFLFSQVPIWMQTVAALFPLKWMAQGLRSVFLPDALAAQEPAGSPGSWAGWPWCWASGASSGWCCASRTFRWQDRGTALSYVRPGACTADRRDHRPRAQGAAARPPGRRPAAADGAGAGRRVRLPRAAGRRPREPGHAGSGRPPTPARWCSTWRPSRTPSG